MSSFLRRTSKISSLEAARSLFLVIVGFAIKQSLTLFSSSFNEQPHTQPVQWGWWLVGAGYLVTILRFSHGIFLLYGFEKQKAEISTLASARRITLHSTFIIGLGIVFCLMADQLRADQLPADQLAQFRRYLFWTTLMLIWNLLYLTVSGVVGSYYRRPIRVWRETSKGYIPHAAIRWITLDAILIIACLVCFWRTPIGFSTPWFIIPPNPHERFFAGVLIGFALLDYYSNWAFYFGGSHDWRIRKRFVFISSPIGDKQAISNNIRRAESYCADLLKTRRRYHNYIIPFAPRVFYSYLVDQTASAHTREIIRQCALAYLTACDAIYIYVPYARRRGVHWLWRAYKLLCMRRRVATESDQPPDNSMPAEPSADEFAWARKLFWHLDKSETTSGMDKEIEEAKKTGLHFEYFPIIEFTTESDAPFKPPCSLDKPSNRKSADHAIRKRVYICTEYRGRDFNKDEVNKNGKIGELKTTIRKNTALALLCCYQLLNDPQEFVAPFAPHIFYPRFCEFIVDDKYNHKKWGEWFTRSREILKVCDAVYIYTPNGDEEDELTSGMKEIKNAAIELGLDIKYKEIPAVTLADGILVC